jgi:hypothetical protein
MAGINRSVEIPQEFLLIRPPEREPRTDLQEILKQLESSGRYGIQKGKYLGAYQMGPGALQDTGYIRSDGSWTGKHGIDSAKDFLNNPRAQDVAQTEWFNVLGDRIRRRGTDDYIGTTVSSDAGDVRVTADGLKMASHLVGDKAMHDWLAGKREEPKDGNGTPASKYLKLGE